ncbi:MAG: SRPBCC family protein [Leeuwenhoekiella sp.]
MITVESSINAPVEKVWEAWTKPEHIIKWNAASDDWHTTKAENDLKPGGRFVYRMEAKDGSMAFDFGGTYEEVETNEKLVYKLDDNRKAIIEFSSEDDTTKLIEKFDVEKENPEEMQKKGWQAILDNFKKYVEAM